MTTSKFAFVVAAGLLASACSSPHFTSTATVQAPPDATATDASFRPDSGAYVIGPQDTLDVQVFGVGALSGTVQVDNTGYVSLPLLGRMKAAGRTTTELSRHIAAELNKKYVKNPIVTVTTRDAASQKITVAGSVTKPGLYEIKPNTTLTQAVAMASGPDQVADIHEVAIIRNTAKGRQVKVYDLDQISDGSVTDPYVHANDEVVVNVSGARKFVRDFGSAFGVLGWLHP